MAAIEYGEDEANVSRMLLFGAPSVMVSGGITYRGHTDLYVFQHNPNARRYCDAILTPIVIPFPNHQANRRLTFQQNEDQPHDLYSKRNVDVDPQFPESVGSDNSSPANYPSVHHRPSEQIRSETSVALEDIQKRLDQLERRQNAP